MILVTGGSGFIGSNLVETLVRRGKGVRILDCIDSEDRPEVAELIKADIRDRKALAAALKNVDTVYHTAALVPLSKAGRAFWEVNVEGTANLLALCRKYGTKRIIHFSSSAVFGIPRSSLTAESRLSPVEPYGRAKAEAEKLVRAYMQEGRCAVIIRPRTLLGEERLGIFHLLFEWVSENRNIYIIGKGDNPFQFLHIDDLIEASIKAAELGRSGIYNLGTDRYRTLREDLSEFITKVGSSSRIVSLPPWIAINALRILDWFHLSPLAPWHYLTYGQPFCFDISREMEVLKWRPRYSNVEMLVSAYHWYLTHKEELLLQQGESSLHHRPVRQRILKFLKWIS